MFSYVSALCGVTNDESSKNGNSISEVRQLCLRSGRRGQELLGIGPIERAQVDGWMKLSEGLCQSASEHLESLNEYLSVRSFLCGSTLTLADITLYFALSSSVIDKQFVNILRWAFNCKYLIEVASSNLPKLELTTQPIYQPIHLPVPSTHNASASASSNESKPSSIGKKLATEVEDNKDKDTEIHEKKKESKKDSKSKSSEDVKPTKAKGKSEESKTLPEVPEADDCDPTKLDIRVGLITKVWPHPEAEKLFCEEIDIGEDKPRQIASGLRLFYKLEDLQGQRVLVLANLKSRALVGFKSEGMVLCASNHDHTIVKLVYPPKDAAVGSRIIFPGRKGEPAAPSQLQKKKILEKLLPLMLTDKDGIPGYDGCPFTVEGAGTCTSEVPNASVA